MQREGFAECGTWDVAMAVEGGVDYCSLEDPSLR